jgi:hypothetical protein
MVRLRNRHVGKIEPDDWKIRSTVDSQQSTVKTGPQFLSLSTVDCKLSTNS